MKDRKEFLEKLQGLVALAKDGAICAEEVQQYFEKDALTEEQMELVFDYLLSQKIVVKGYANMQEEPQVDLTEEELHYLKNYEDELRKIPAEKEGEKSQLFQAIIEGDSLAKTRLIELYLKEVVEIAKEMRHAEIFLGDLIQEGNMGLTIGVSMLTSIEDAERVIRDQIRGCIVAMIREYDDDKDQDQRMVDKVAAMDTAITELTEQMGRKVTIEELAIHLGITEDEVTDILRLTGEDQEEEE